MCMKQIAIFQSDLRVGGIQKALVNILNEIDYSKCCVDVYLFDDQCFLTCPPTKICISVFCRPCPPITVCCISAW